MWNLEVILIMLLVGSFAGFVAGLLGIGGGMVVVPVVLWVLQMQGLGAIDHAQHLAVGTSFAIMVFTTFSSVMAQHRKGGVDWAVVRRMAPGMIAGVMVGSVLAKYISNAALQIFFVVFVLLVAFKTLADAKPKPSRSLPGAAGLTAVGSLFGIASSWVGIGGGSLSVPFMLYCNVPVRTAVGTSAGLAWPIAVAGAVGYLYSGWNVAGLPEGTWGFWYLPAVAVLSVATMLFAPLGVKAAHKLPPEKLKLAFGILLLVIAARMLWGLLH
ncbi:sulfite exporter TauE/SafE family protein [Uruburuella testudinis]|uniref:Probable membrane transporter protein n=1 Tax=Uruburuella testudinis TaxID=1282863 RepID=A0ABY4DR69_9NEIS|nr:sulfite exporter TauE/SafE family protein [Uruburuella testudinis]UOO81210.1 sulfite exporter TauE/SafE family protein [Uruburuella testudinis]